LTNLTRPIAPGASADNPTGWEAVAVHHYVLHIRRIGEEKRIAKGEKRYPAWWSERLPVKQMPRYSGVL
jgi:hypothetical protein